MRFTKVVKMKFRVKTNNRELCEKKERKKDLFAAFTDQQKPNDKIKKKRRIWKNHGRVRSL